MGLGKDKQRSKFHLSKAKSVEDENNSTLQTQKGVGLVIRAVDKSIHSTILAELSNMSASRKNQSA